MAEPQGQMPAAEGRGHLRASHADREHAIEMLKAAYVHGMMAKDELDARLGQALISRTYADLAALTADIPAQPAAAGSARPPAPVRHWPLARAAGKSGGCLAIAAAAMWGHSILDPGATPTPYGSWAKSLFFIVLVSVLAALGILANGAVTSWDQRRSRRQLPPRPGPGGHALDGQRHGGPGRDPASPGPGDRQARAGLRARKPRQQTFTRAGQAPCSARPAPGTA